MKARKITRFATQFGVQVGLNEDLLVEKNGRYFLVNAALKPLVRRDFFYAGVFLGKAKGSKFFPSFNLLGMLAKKGANHVIIDDKAAWLFTCGRDVLNKSILRVHGPAKKNTSVLVFNEFAECLGFGRIVGKLSETKKDNEIAVRNVSDIGDFLRREQ
jgi:ribosome biogenesis protein Nip4